MLQNICVLNYYLYNSMSNFKISYPKGFFYRIVLKTKKHNGDTLETLLWDDMELDFRNRWEWYFRYRASLLQVQNPKFYVETHRGYHDASSLLTEKILAKRKKNKITTCKRMITQFSNAIEEYKSIESNKLIPNWNHPKYLKCLKKLEEYKKELKTLNN